MIGLVVVSHSRKLAEGVAELAGQMAPDVTIAVSGGDGHGGLGTDFLAVSEAIAAADSGDGVVVLFDLGSAKMVADMAAEEASAEVRVVDAPLVEGAVAAAVAAQGGANLAAVTSAAASSQAPPTAPPLTAPPPTDPASPERPSADPALSVPRETIDSGAGGKPGSRPESRPGVQTEAPTGSHGDIRVTIALTNEVGLHARPAALVARSLAGLDARVTVRLGDQEADATSVLALMGLGAPGGASVDVIASGPDAAEAVRRVEDLAARHFDE